MVQVAVADPHDLSIAEAGRALRSGQITSVGLTEAALNRIKKYDPQICAVALITEDSALERALVADAELHAGVDRGPLHGIPYGLKDIYATAGIATRCNSRLMAKNVPAEDSTVESRLKAAGAILVGKLNTAEFALGGGEDLPMSSARNPWNIEHFSGTSSNGSGAAVAAGFVRFAMGSDTGGSIRSPAFHCGVVGLKPTYGSVSRHGVFPLSYSLDHCGPIAGCVEDAALVMNHIAGCDPLDPATATFPIPDYSSALGHTITGVRIGYARSFFTSVPGVSDEVVATIDDAAEQLSLLGADVEEIDLPDFELFKACSRIIMLAEAFSIHRSNLRERPEEFGRYTYQRVAPAASLSAADYIEAQRLRRRLTVAINSGALTKNHMLLTASGLSPASRLDEFPIDWPPPGLAVAVHTAPFNVTGNPALALPTGLSRCGLPLGVQLIGRPFDEQRLLGVASALEAALGFCNQRPLLRAAGTGY